MVGTFVRAIYMSTVFEHAPWYDDSLSAVRVGSMVAVQKTILLDGLL